MKSKAELASFYLSLVGSAEPQKRGREFEQLLFYMLNMEGLQPELGPPHRGQQCDISLASEGRLFLMEAKWHRLEKPIQAHQIFSFRGKLEGRLIATIGLFVSMSGYTRNAVSAVTFGRSINTILFDRRDIELALESHSFTEVLQAKLRRAAAFGDVYYSFQTLLDLSR